MLETIHNLAELWTRLMQRHALIVILLFATLSWGTLDYTGTHLGINTDTEDMLSAELQWRKNNKLNSAEFPQFSSVIAVVIDAQTAGQAQDVALKLAKRLETESSLFEWVFRGQDETFFRQNGLLYKDLDELQTLADELSVMQPFLSRLQRDPSLRGLFSVLNEAVTEISKGESLETGDAFNQIAGVIDATVTGNNTLLSWQRLLDGNENDSKPTTADKRRVLVVKPRLDYSSLLPGKEAVLAVRGIATEMHLTPDNGITVRVTGGAALSYEELESVSRGAGVAGLLALVMVTIILTLGMRSLWLVVASLVTLIMGLIMTAGFAAWAIGELNLISVAFAVLYIGLGIDFAIHYCLRYRELLQDGVEKSLALSQTGSGIGSSLTLCAITTATGFYAFIPTDYSGVAELGLISGTGTFISLVLSLSLLPALLTLLPPPTRFHRSHNRLSTIVDKLTPLPGQYPKRILMVAIIFTLLSVILLNNLRFDPNPLNLQDPETESVQTYRDLIADSDTTPWSIVVLTHNPAEAEEMSKQLEQLQTVDSVMSLYSFAAEDQQDKVYLVEDIDLLLGPDLHQTISTETPSLKEQIQTLEQLIYTLQIAFSANTIDSRLQELQSLHDALISLMSWLKPSENSAISDQQQKLDELQYRLLSTLPGRLDALRDALAAEEFTLDKLPENIRSRWVSDNNMYRLEVIPVGDLTDQIQLEQFVTEVRQIAPGATDSPVVFVEASRAVVQAFQQAFLSALILIALLLIFLLEKKRDALIVLAPLILAGLLTGAASILLNMPFNFANIIALPLLLGIGVDSGVHMVQRFREGTDSVQILRTSTARAVFISSLTTVCSFGNLAFSSHLGTASMGVMLTLGVGFTLICTLIILPALLHYFSPSDTSSATATIETP